MRRNVARPLGHAFRGAACSPCLGHGFVAKQGRWARYSLCGTARQSCPVCTIWATGPCDVVASVVFSLFVFVLTFLLLLPFLQGSCAFASKVAHLRDPELRKLAEGLSLRAAKPKP